ncbi:MAG: calcium/sodium antiporter [Paludibacteraceae bacterium]|nr:calcium/sodium antiporter [Paludibacteraceae bacterium]
MWLDVLIALASFALLVWSADKMVEGSASIATRFHISNVLIGLTIVAFGTSAPELIISSISSYQGQSAMAMGNVMGSNIFNVLAILGVTSLITIVPVQRQTILFEVPLMIAATAMIAISFYSGDGGDLVINRIEASVMLVGFVVFLIYIIISSRNQAALPHDEEVEVLPIWKSILWVVIGIAGLLYGGHLLVNKAVLIAQGWGISEHIIAVTIVSVGTSLPELVTSVVAAYKKNTDMAVGNIIGSCLFNSFAILGISAMISPISLNMDVDLDIKVNFLAAILLYVFIFTGKGRNIERWEGCILLSVFAGYMYMLL